MALHGRHLLATAGITALVLALFPTLAAAEAEPAGDAGTDDVLVLGLTDSEGDPTTLVEEEAGAGAQLFRTQSSAVMTSALDVPEFTVAGVTWDGDDAPEGRIELRVRAADGWTEWQELEPEIGEEGEVAGTEPFIVGSGTGVQVRIGGGDGTLPDSLELHLIPPNPTDQDVRVADVAKLADLDVTALDDEPTHEPAPAPADDEAPAVEPETEQDVAQIAAQAETHPRPEVPSAQAETHPRPEVPSAQAQAQAHAQAGPQAQPQGEDFGVSAGGLRTPNVATRADWGADESKMTWTPRNDELRAAVVHHTAGTNNYTRAQSAGIVRGIYHYHAVSRDWGDIGYNFLVDKYGQVFEGRAGSIAAPAGLMPEAAHARGFNRGTLGISVLGDYSTLYAPESILNTMAHVIAWKFAAAGIDLATPSGMISPGTAARPKGQNLPRVYAHRDVGATTCPGNNIYARIPMLHEKVATFVDGAEYHLRNSLSGGDAHLAFSLGLSTDEVLVGDWDGDGKDTLALRRGNTYLVYDNHPGQQFRTVRYGRPDDVVLVGDWNGDGKDTFAVRRGAQYHVKNSMTGGDADRVIYYGRANDAVLVGDWNGNGGDTFAVRRGAEYHVKNRIAGGDADRVFHYGRANDDVLVGDWNRDGTDTFAVRRGREYHVRNSLTGGDADNVLIYGRADDVVLVGDWNGDGRDTFGVRRSG